MSDQAHHGSRALARAVIGLLLAVTSVATYPQAGNLLTSQPPPQSSPALPSAGPLDSVRSGPWMVSVKRLFGVMMLALAIYLVSPVIPLVAQQLLWAALLIVSAVFLHAIDPLPHDAPGHRRLFKGVGVIGLAGGVALLAGVLSGSKDLL